MSGGLLLGVDGGGTTTHAVVADRTGRVVGRGLGPPSNYHKVGFEKMCRALTVAIEGALAQALTFRGLAPGERSWRGAGIEVACLGIAGVDRIEDQDLVSRWVREQAVAARFVVLNDSELILSGGTPEGWGVALISGTGSICVGRSRDGRVARVGGWGHLFGDEGSGYHLSVEALRLAAQTADGRADAHGVLQAVMSHWKLRAPEDLIGYVYRPDSTHDELAGLAAPVLELAARGDGGALQLLDTAGKALARHIDTVVRKLGLERPPLALGGGTLRAGLRKAVVENLSVEMGPVNVVADPALGAVAMARRMIEEVPAAG